jgi:hypothetical protein
VASYYFTILKKLQVFNHVPANQFHGASPAQNNFDLKDPHMLFKMSNRGAVLGAGLNDSPVYQVLLARSMGTPGFTLINVNGTQWPVMPPQLLPAWNDFQANPPNNKFLDVFADWIQNNHADDVPDGVIQQMPSTIVNGLGQDPTLFVCSNTGDDGTRPGNIPNDYWATSLIFLTNPSNGAIAQNVQTLFANDHYNLVAVVGNRYNAGYGRYLPSTTEPCEANCWVMVYNAGMGPGVQLPALSNLDPASTNGIYDIYFLRPGEYDLVGFKLDVQTVFDGLVEAVKASGMNLGGLTPEQWLKDQSAGAHLCAKVSVRRSNSDSWPTTSDTPLTNPRVAQKNLAPFDINLAESTPNPPIFWKNFSAGDPLKMMRTGDIRWGQNRLVLRAEGLTGNTKLYLAAPRETIKRYFTRAALRSMKRCDEKLEKRLRNPYPQGMMFELPREGVTLDLNPLRDDFIALSLGILCDRARLRPGPFGKIAVVQQTLVPEIKDFTGCCYELEYKTGGGFTIELRAYDTRILPKGDKEPRPIAKAKAPAKAPAKTPAKPAAKAVVKAPAKAPAKPTAKVAAPAAKMPAKPAAKATVQMPPVTAAKAAKGAGAKKPRG